MAEWCERRDSNSHRLPHWNLNPARLPIPPLSLEIHIKLSGHIEHQIILQNKPLKASLSYQILIVKTCYDVLTIKSRFIRNLSMLHRPYRTILLLTVITSLSLLSLCSYANEVNITKVVDEQGLLTAVTITTPKVVFQVGVNGSLNQIELNNRKLAQMKSFTKLIGRQLAPQPSGLIIKKYPKSVFDGNGGKVAKVNGIRITYYSCMANNSTLTGVTRYGEKNGLSGEFPIT